MANCPARCDRVAQGPCGVPMCRAACRLACCGVQYTRPGVQSERASRQYRVQRRVQPVRCHALRQGTSGDRQHARARAQQRSCSSRVVQLILGEAPREDAIHPALHLRRHSRSAERKGKADRACGLAPRWQARASAGTGLSSNCARSSARQIGLKPSARRSAEFTLCPVALGRRRTDPRPRGRTGSG